MRVVEDYNEVQHHILEVVYTHLVLTRGSMHGAGGATGGMGMRPMDTAMGGMGDGMSRPAAGGMGGGGAGAMLPPSTTQSAKVVFEAIRGVANNDGMHVHAISQRTGMNMDQVAKAVDELLATGIAFTTIDDNHIAVMDF